MAKKIKHGAICHAGGRTIEIVSEHPEWLEWALKTLYAAEHNRPMRADETPSYTEVEFMGEITAFPNKDE